MGGNLGELFLETLIKELLEECAGGIFLNLKNFGLDYFFMHYVVFWHYNTFLSNIVEYYS